MLELKQTGTFRRQRLDDRFATLNRSATESVSYASTTTPAIVSIFRNGEARSLFCFAVATSASGK
jgi:hypothetical protein